MEVRNTPSKPESLKISDITYFDKMRKYSVKTNHSSVVQLHTTTHSKDMFEKETERTFNLRHITSLLPFIPIEPYIQVTFEAFAAGVLAVHHFNNGISDIVPQLSSTKIKCPDLKFTTSMIETKLSPMFASRQLSDLILQNQIKEREIKNNKHNIGENDEDSITPSTPYPTSLIAYTRSQVMSPLAKLAGIFGIPQVLCTLASPNFDNKDEYPLTGKITPSVAGEAEAAISYLSDVLGGSHLFVIFTKDYFGLNYFNALNNAAASSGIKILSASIPYNSNENHIRKAVLQFQESGYRYCFGAIFQEDLKEVLVEAHQKGVAGPGYFWIVSDRTSFHPSAAGMKLQTKKESSLIEAMTGAAVISFLNDESSLISEKSGVVRERLDGFIQAVNETFLATPSGQEYFRSKIAKSMRYAFSDKFFEQYQLPKTAPGLALRIYESVIVWELAACDAESRVGVEFEGKDLFASFLETEFDSVNGRVAFDRKTGTRLSENLKYSLINIVPSAPTKENSKYTTFHFDKVTHVYEPNIISNINENNKHNSSSIPSSYLVRKEWRKVPNIDFTYSDGTTEPPDFLPPLQNEENSIGTGAIALGLIFCWIILGLSLWFGCWTAYHRNSKVIKASQPIFLGMLCVGTFMMGLSIIPMSLQDPSLSQNTLNTACMSTVWLLSIGFVVSFSALISKLIRINKIFNAKSHNRVTVKPHHVLGPFIFLFSANIIVLVLWTFLSPLKFRHETKSAVDRFGRPYEYFGTCYSNDPSASDLSFLVLLIGINIVSLMFANYQAYLARDIEIQYSESHSIAISMQSMLQLSFVGITALISTYEFPSAQFIVSSSLVTMICVAIILPIFIPKRMFLAKWKKEVLEKEMRRSERLKRVQEFQKNQAWAPPPADVVKPSPVDTINIKQEEEDPNLKMDFEEEEEEEERGLKIMNSKNVESERLSSELEALKKENSILQEKCDSNRHQIETWV